MADLITRAVRAIREHEHWHQEVDRLTAAIRECECPEEMEDGGSPWEPDVAATAVFGGSHFQQAKARLEEGRGSGPDGYRSLRLPEIAKDPAVQACPACSRLCELIAERKVAKQKRAAAKRWIRTLGKIALREVGDD